MVALTLPDGKVRSYPGPATGAELAKDIGPGLAKAAMAIRVNGKVWDLTRPIELDATVSIVTRKDDDATVYDIIRHDTAHILAEAVKELYPETQVTIGPNVEDGFYYDFARKTPFTPEDLARIEERMREIVKRNEPLVREVWDRQKAVSFFESLGEKYKAEIINAFPPNEEVSVYKQGTFIDLCRGPHGPTTGHVGTGFKLMKIAGAYWRGDSKNEMLQRVYGTAWRDERELAAYLTRLEEAEKRDHRRLGREMDLFHFQEEAAGMPFWHAKGWTLYRVLEDYIRARLKKANYIEVHTPQLIDRSLWEQSGHWEKFGQNMYTTESEDRTWALKPMNCPAHIQIYKQGLKSYRDLPLRMAEFGCCHRFEPSGALHGLMRVRAFTQDDAHIFCTEAQITPETKAFCELLLDVYKDFGFTDVRVKFSDRPKVRAGSDETWDRAESALRDAAKEAGLEVQINPGEGAFYGPKLEFVLRDAIGRDWQCGTLQVDFVLPERLGAQFVDEDGTRKRPVMLHRAILGSLERFTGVLIEHYAGRLPLWLAPVQVSVVTITQDSDAYATEVNELLKAAGLRPVLDLANDKINYKIREHSLAKVPVILAIGKREAEQRTVSVRRLGSERQEVLALDEALTRLRHEAQVGGQHLQAAAE
ncbi:MAG: threonine--tRNA ligase [Alphaproteobacteria bacterium]|nr:threonine--tRNA ligase [Alphaproteobacteria bacterium]